MTPYEIRLHLLELSFNILSAQSVNKSTTNELTVTPPVAPSVEQVIEHARTLNNFVCTDK